MESNTWRNCSSCKKAIPLKGVYWTCNVSTCNRKRTGLVFCSVACWDAHVPMMNHRESWAIENHAPAHVEKSGAENEEGVENEQSLEKEKVKMEGTEKEILIVASKLKNYIREKSGMNTSAAVVDVLSDKIREITDQAIESAKREGRKTVMDRDFGAGEAN